MDEHTEQVAGRGGLKEGITGGEGGGGGGRGTQRERAAWAASGR